MLSHKYFIKRQGKDMNNKLGQSFEKVIDNLNIDKLMILKQLPDDIKYDAQEIRFRINACLLYTSRCV